MKYFFTLIVTGILFITTTSFPGIFQTGVTITVDMPDVIDAGAEITVNVTINKGKVSGFARYQQVLPAGLTAKSNYSANANFSFQDQKVQLVWIALPAQSEIKLSYKIVANERLTGSIDLDGQFTFIDDNAPRTTNMRSKLLAINPSAEVSPEKRVDIKDFGKVASIEAEALGSGQTAAFRQQPFWMEEDRFFLVTVLINRDAVRKFAKIEETIPSGFTATNLDSKGGTFDFKNQVASIIWMDLPLEPYFTITYKLIPVGGSAAPSVNISGLFTFMISDRTFELPIIERSERLAGLSREQVNRLIRNMSIPSSEQPPVHIADSQNGRPPDTQPQDSPPGTTLPPSIPRPSTDRDNYELVPETGIYYRVQIAAGHRLIDIRQHFRRFRLDPNAEIKREDHEGWYKYTIGSFVEYQDARDYRVYMSSSTRINDAFVAAYNNGKRITVQDALMALNQRWVR